MAYQILFTDLDGTLLDSHGRISEANKQAAARAIERGKEVVLCSGRSWRSMALFEKEMGLNQSGRFGVSFNGGIIYTYDADGAQQPLIRYPMETALAGQIIAEVKRIGGDILVYAGDELLAERENANTERYGNAARLPVRMLDDFREITDGYIKILVKGANELLQSVAAQGRLLFPGRCNIFFSAPELLEFCPPQVHKGSAVAYLAQHLGIPVAETIAMGDESNDLTMLQAAGLGVAVANATAEVKAAADVTLPYDNDQDALRQVIERYLL